MNSNSEPAYEQLLQRIEKLEKEASERNRLETALTNAEGELKALYDCLRDGIALVDMDGTVVKINKSLLRLGGYPEEEIIGKPFRRLHMFTPESISRMLYSFARIVEDKAIPPFEVEGYTKSGERKVLEVYSALFEKGGEVHGVVVVMKDITGTELAGREAP
jgi:PAS domain S-box-containing protein